MIIEKKAIQHRDVVSKLVVTDSLENFDSIWEDFLREVYDLYGGAAEIPFYSFKYSRDSTVGVEMYAPVLKYMPGKNSDFRHHSYFEIGPLLGSRVRRGDEDETTAVMGRIREHLLENKLVQTSPMFLIPSVDGDVAYTDIFVVYRQLID